MHRDDKRISVAAHLEEIRSRVLTAFIFFLAATGVSFCFVETGLDILKIPAGGQLGPLAVFSPTTAILTFIKIAAFAGFCLSSPVVLYEVWMFILPALEPKHARHGLLFVTSGMILFAAGAGFSFFFLLPPALHFLLSIGRGELQFIISLDAYVSFVLLLLAAGGAVFEMPVLIFILARMRVLTARAMIRSWKAAVVFIMVGAALVTPTPDVVNMILMSLPMAALYIVSIGVARMAQKD